MDAADGGELVVCGLDALPWAEVVDLERGGRCDAAALAVRVDVRAPVPVTVQDPDALFAPCAGGAAGGAAPGARWVSWREVPHAAPPPMPVSACSARLTLRLMVSLSSSKRRASARRAAQ